MDQFQLNIADLLISIHCIQLPIHREDEPAYLSFVCDESNVEAAPDIEIKLEVGKPPDVRGWINVFEDGQSRSIYRDQEDYVMHFTPARHGKEPLWVAQYSQKCDRVVIICSERLICQRNGHEGILNPFRYPLDQHLIMYHLANNKGILVHAAGFINSQRGFIFPGRSGAGKSTLSRLFSNSRIWQGLSDDRMLLRNIDQEVLCFGTPWPGEEGLAKNIGARLSGIFFLCPGQENCITELNPRDAIRKLIPVVSIPWYDEGLLVQILLLCEELVSQIPVFELCFRPTEEVIELVEGFVFKEGMFSVEG